MNQLDSLGEGGSFSLYCSNVVGVLWERVYRKRNGKIEAITIASGCFSEWREVEDPAEDVRRTQETIAQVWNDR